MRQVSVIVPARDAAATLGETLDGLAGQEGLDDGAAEVLVVDNASSDETAEVARRHPIGARVLRGPGDSPASARNVGAGAAEGAVLAFTDADCRPAPRWLATALAALEDADLVQGAVRPAPGPARTRFDRTLEVLAFSGLFETANLVVRREAFDRVGGFEALILPGEGRPFGEDVLFGWRAVRAGLRVTFAADVLVHHAVFPQGPAGWIAEHRRRRFFPALAREVPEIRDATCWRRRFLTARGAAFDAAVVATWLAALTRRPGPAAGVLPYVAFLLRDAARRPSRSAVPHAAVDVAADAVSAAALLGGSVRSRSLLL